MFRDRIAHADVMEERREGPLQIPPCETVHSRDKSYAHTRSRPRENPQSSISPGAQRDGLILRSLDFTSGPEKIPSIGDIKTWRLPQRKSCPEPRGYQEPEVKLQLENRI